MIRRSAAQEARTATAGLAGGFPKQATEEAVNGRETFDGDTMTSDLSNGQSPEEPAILPPDAHALLSLAFEVADLASIPAVRTLLSLLVYYTPCRSNDATNL